MCGGDFFFDFEDCPERSGFGGRTTGTSFSLVRNPDCSLLGLGVCYNDFMNAPDSILNDLIPSPRHGLQYYDNRRCVKMDAADNSRCTLYIPTLSTRHLSKVNTPIY